MKEFTTIRSDMSKRCPGSRMVPRSASTLPVVLYEGVINFDYKNAVHCVKVVGFVLLLHRIGRVIPLLTSLGAMLMSIACRDTCGG